MKAPPSFSLIYNWNNYVLDSVFGLFTSMLFSVLLSETEEFSSSFVAVNTRLKDLATPWEPSSMSGWGAMNDALLYKLEFLSSDTTDGVTTVNTLEEKPVTDDGGAWTITVAWDAGWDSEDCIFCPHSKIRGFAAGRMFWLTVLSTITKDKVRN